MFERLPDESSTNRRNRIFTRFAEFSIVCETSAKHGVADVVVVDVVVVERGVVFIKDFGLIGLG
jgi:hypothetical protein